MRRAKELIFNLIMSWGQGERIALLFAGSGRNGRFFPAEKYWNLILSHTKCKAEVETFLCARKKKAKSYEKFYDTESLERIDKKFDKIIIASWQGEEFLCDWFIENRPKQKFFALYDYFEENNLFLNHEWFEFIRRQKRPWYSIHQLPLTAYEDITDCITFEFNRQQYKKGKEKPEELNIVVLKKCFFLSIIMKNFIKAERFYKEIAELENDSPEIEAWEKIQDLLGEIREFLRKRSQKDILMFWVDTVSYDDAKSSMPLLWREMNSGIFFENMWGVSNWTDPAMKAIFCGKTLDDYSWRIGEISSETSMVIKELEKNHFNIRFLGSHLKGISERFRPEEYTMDIVPVSSRLWDVLRELVICEESPCFVVSHIFQECHATMLSTRMRKNILQKYREEGLEEIDEQISYYKMYFPKLSTNIYMSDHGYDFTVTEISHTFMGICGDGVLPCRVRSMLSHTDFFPIFHSILAGRNISEAVPKRKYVEVLNKKRIFYINLSSSVSVLKFFFSFFVEQ